MPKDKLAKLIRERLYDPGRFVDRKNIDSKTDREPLDAWKLRAVMQLFIAADIRDNKGTSVIVTYCKENP